MKDEILSPTMRAIVCQVNRAITAEMGDDGSAISQSMIGVGTAMTANGASVCLFMHSTEGDNVIASLDQPEFSKLVALLVHAGNRAAELSISPKHEPEVRRH